MYGLITVIITSELRRYLSSSIIFFTTESNSIVFRLEVHVYVKQYEYPGCKSCDVNHNDMICKLMT